MAKSSFDAFSPNISQKEYDKAFGITPEVRKELNDPKGWITNTGTPIKKFSHKKIPKGKGKQKGKSKKRGYKTKTDKVSTDIPEGTEVKPVDAQTEAELNASSEVD